jgi:pilus assembly protein TadC
MNHGIRVDLAEFDDRLIELYVERGYTLRETFKRLQADLDEHEWTTELGVRYRLQELGYIDPHGK